MNTRREDDEKEIAALRREIRELRRLNYIDTNAAAMVKMGRLRRLEQRQKEKESK